MMFPFSDEELYCAVKNALPSEYFAPEEELNV